MNQEKAGFSEQAVNNVVALAIASQLKRSAGVEVQIKTTLSKIMKGKLDSMSIRIRGLLMQQNLEVEELHLQIGQIQVKISSALRGKIVLMNPSEGILRLVINESILTSALNIETIQSILSPTSEPQFSESPNQEETPCITCSLSAQSILLDICSPQAGTEVSPRSRLAITPEISADREEVDLRNHHIVEGAELEPLVVTAILAHLSELLSLREFAQKGTILKIQTLDISDSKLTLDSTAYIEYFPD